MKIGIIDADLIGRKKQRFPNLACMKISGFNKANNNNIELLLNYNDIDNFDKVYISKVFTDTPIPEDIINRSNVIYGGTGFYGADAPFMEDEIEHHKPDYDLYRKWANNKIREGNPKSQYSYYLDSSIGFTTRGCFRHCKFCVNSNYSKVILWSPIEEFLDKQYSRICLLDDNIMGYEKAKDIWGNLQITNKIFEYKQGMDFRLLTKEKIQMILDASNFGKRSLIFAFDNIEDKDIIIKKLELYRDMTKRFTRFYILSGFDRENKYDDFFWERDLYSVFERIKILMKYGCIPYFMRYKKWIDSPYRGTYSNLNAWCNYPRNFKKMSYRELCKAYSKWSKVEKSSYQKHMENLERKLPELAKLYFDIKFEETTKYGSCGK